ncbi:MAG: flagellar cap protein FliD N-terminal domain-containing protein, partial [Oscillospiraceae bacterium]
MSFSINSYSTIASRNGVGGLMSGMDTDELVEKMTTGTREKIKNQLSKKQTTMWKQEAYRDVIDSANSFQQKWLSFSAGKNNIASPSFFDTKTITSSSEYLDVSGSASAAERIQINDIKQLAETATMTSNDKLSSQTLSTGYIETGWVASTINGQSVDVTLDGQGYAIRVSSGFGYKNNPDHSKPDTKQQLEQ